jgi:hypothetical protein
MTIVADRNVEAAPAGAVPWCAGLAATATAKRRSFSVYYSRIIPAAWRLFNDVGNRVLAV